MKNAAAILGVLLAFACSNRDRMTEQKPAPAGQRAAAAAPARVLTGRVLETFDGGGYTYLRLATSGGEQWAAVPEMEVARDQTVTLQVQMTMEQFQSASLNRTFERIVFATPAGSAGASAQGGTHQVDAPEAEPIAVEKAPGGLAVAEVWASKTSLNGRTVVVRGRVVKVHSGIMGTNWLHLQDGTGSRSGGNHDLTVTTDGMAKVGDVVTIRGIVAVDRDFGSGYRYPVIVEKATITAEKSS